MGGPRLTAHVPSPAPPGRYTSNVCNLATLTLIVFLVPAQASAQRRIDTYKGQNGPPQTSAQRVANLNGQIATDKGVAVKNAMVKLETSEGEQVDERPASAAGQFFFTNVLKGEYVLVVSAEGFDTYREAVNLWEGGPDQYISVNITASKAARAQAEPPALSDAQAPKKARHDYQKAEKAFESRQYGEARRQLEAAVDQYPCYARAQTKLGLLMSQQKDDKGAEAAFRKSISCDAGFLDAYLELGQLLNGERRFDEAAPVLGQGLRQAPASWRFYYEEGVAQYGLGHYDLAEQQFGEAKSLTPEPPAELYAKLADFYLREQSFQKAYASMQDYLKADPDGPFAPRIRTIMKQVESSGALQSR
jgi:tetratricopeptide (TPR) repeat protein